MQPEFPGTDRFDIRRTLGAGGMGVVYEAYDRERGAIVAIKTLLWATAASLYRFKREFRALAHIEHPNLINLGELIESDGVWFYTMDFIDGVDFLRHVKGEAAGAHDFEHELTPPRRLTGRLACDEERLRPAARQLAIAIAALHDAGKLHRDIKPSNILVTREGRVVLLDFGLVADAHDEVHASSHDHVVGTAAYMAPEQALGGAVGAAADWYSFGVVLYEALTGRLPHGGGHGTELLMRKLQYEPPPPRMRNPGVPRDLDSLCADLLIRNPAERPTARAILDRLGVDAGDGAPPVPAHTTSQLTAGGIFVGRDAELAALHAAYGATRRGAPEVVLIEGESGVGKSTLVAHFVDAIRAEVSDAVVLIGRCYERESVPYKAFDGVIDALSRYLSRLPREDAAALLPLDTVLLARAFPVLGRVEVVARERASPRIEDPHELRRRTFAAVRELLLRLAETRPLIVAIEDLQWADRDSLLLLEDVLQPPRAPPLLLLLTARPAAPVAGQSAPPELAPLEAPSLERLEGTRRLTLGPLDPAAAQELAHLLVRRGGAGHHGDPAVIAAEAAGHPLYIAELVRHAASVGSGHAPRLDEAIAARVAGLDPPLRAILELVCVAGAALPQSWIARAAEVDTAAFARQLSMLRFAHLVRTGGAGRAATVEPYHDRVREAVVAGLPPPVRARHHARLSLVLQSAGAAGDLVLRHLEAAGDAERAARFAAEAAERAERALAFDRASLLYGRALQLGAWSDGERGALRLQQAEALANAGRGDAAADAFLSAATAADPTRRLACRTRAAEQLMITGYVDRGLEVLAELLSGIGVPLARSPWRALVSVLWHRLRLRLRGLAFHERHDSEIAHSELTRIDVFRAAGLGLSMIDTIRGADFNARHLLVALDAGEVSRLVPALGMEAAYLSSQGARSMRRARVVLERCREIAARTGDPYHRAWVAAIGGAFCYFEGRFADATALLGDAARMFREETTGSTFDLNLVRTFRIVAHRLRGDLTGFRALIGECIADAVRRGDRYLETTTRLVGNQVWLAADDVERAEDTFAQAAWSPPPGAFHLQHWYELEARGELALYRGTAGAALPTLEASFAGLRHSLLVRIGTVRSMAHWLRARLLVAAAGDDHRRLAAARRLARKLAAERLDYAASLAALIRAAVACREGDRDGAARQLRIAIESAGDDMLLVAACARHRLGELIGGDEGRGLIRDAEAWMATQPVASPAGMLRLITPGFE